MAMQRAKTRRGGCSGLIAAGFFVCAFAGILFWPKYVDANGGVAPGVISQKNESVRIHYGEWYRSFEIIATYEISGQRFEHRAGCNVDEGTYDSLHVGNGVTVHYLLNMLSQPFFPVTHLSPCSTLASVNANPAVMTNLAVAFAALLVILFLWRVVRVRLAGWLLIPWAGVFFFYFCMPRLEPAPDQPRPAKAMVQSIDKITNLLETDDSRGISLQHPYEIVRFKFSPEGMDTPVVGVDKIDAGSIPNLKENQTVDVFYDAGHPRIARLQGGTRLFPGQARTTVLLTCGAIMGFLLVLGMVGWLLRLGVRLLK